MVALRRLASGNESYNVHANADAKSLGITAKGRVVSPTFCVSSQHPSFRFFAKRTSGSWGVLNVSLRWSVDGGATNETTVGSVATGTSWTPTQSFGLSQTLGIWNSSQTASVQIILDPEDYGGNWAVDGMTNAPVVRSRSSGAGDQARDVLMHTMRAKQPGLQDHSSQVAELAVAVARRLGMTAEEVDEVGRAAELHDVGKVGIPDAILDKPGPLDPHEWEFMRQHTILGERILSAAAALRPVAVIVRASHERWDGHGYPDGLRATEIPRGSRVVAVCDAFQAMTADRPYRRALSTEAACAELLAAAGTQFDPVVVAVFVEEIERRATSRADAGDRVDRPVQVLADRVRSLLHAA